MNKKRISWIAGLLIIIGLIGSFVTFQPLEKSASFSEEKTISSAKVSSIHLETDNAKIEVIPFTTNEIKLEFSGNKREKKELKFEAKVKEDTLSIEVGEKQQIRLFSFNMDSNPTLKVYLPEKHYKSLQLKTDNGRVSISDAIIDEMQVQSNNGRITLTNIQSVTTEVSSDNGEISLENVDGTLKGITSNGRVNLKTADLDRNIQLETDNGSIEIVTEKDPINTSFNVSVDNGHINILDKYTGSAVVGNGENKIKLKTNNGRITVTK